MDVPSPPRAVAAVAGFVRDRLTDVSGTVLPLIAEGARLELGRGTAHDRSVLDHACRLGGLITGAAAPFAPNPYARVRLIRQMHAAGLLTGEQVRCSAPTEDQPAGDTPGVAGPR